MSDQCGFCGHPREDVVDLRAKLKKVREERDEARETAECYAIENETSVEHRVIKERDRLRAELASIKACVDEQAEDPALWLIQPTITEAYLQQELRRLHAVIEGEVLPGAEKEAT